MRIGILVTAACAGLAFSGLEAAAQAPAGTAPPRENPNVPAVTGDRQQVPMGGNSPTDTANSTSGSATGLTIEQRPRLRQFALQHREAEVKLRDDIGIDTVLPETATLLEIPPEFGLARYRLALANQLTLLVDPSTRRVVEVIR